jgi:hypothetical protein
MYKFKTVLIGLAIAFAPLPLAANAAGYGAGSSSGASLSQGANAYGPASPGNIMSNATTNFAPGNGGSTSFSGMTGNVHVQTNINNTKVINSSSNVSVTQTINGSNVAYGLDGAQALNVIDSNSAEDAGISAMYTGNALNMESEALAVAQSMGY